jgi:enediyne polyketide synthase
MASIAIVGMACRYPDARTPRELWENVLAQRRAFRRIPSERLRLEDYHDATRNGADSIYCTDAAVIEGYEFDRMQFRVSGSTFRSVDMAHWLALDVAAQALEDAGFPNGEGLPLDTCGVLLGNTLTGEFSRASQMRLRWPYVNRVVQAALAKREWPGEQSGPLLEELEALYKAPFPPVGEETLAGGLSNTIAGRICNYFDLKGGGYTIDGACASSLLAISQACSALAAGDLDVALAGGVDLSLDPFELVGFSRLGALADGEMRVFDRHSGGFLPGEGCGFLVLMRADDARSKGQRVYATIRGWGISSDGKGGITRPEVEGQLLALRRAYRRAGIEIDTVGYFEGHGTGTAVGDTTELRVLSRARRESASTTAAVVGSVKANIGHTKAAAGVAGVIKATLAVHEQILPPATGWVEPSPELNAAAGLPALRLLDRAEPWPAQAPLRAGVSAMGFGGINSHLVLEGVAVERRSTLTNAEVDISTSAQDAEVFLIEAANTDELKHKIQRIAGVVERASRSELSDMAAALAREITFQGMRAAVVASTPAEFASRLRQLHARLEDKANALLDVRNGIFLGETGTTPRIGFVFPGQAAPVYREGGALRRRFQSVHELFAGTSLPVQTKDASTALAQPAIVLNSLAALRILNRLGINASIGVGHSLGELTALTWAGALDEKTVLRIAAARGRAMEELSDGPGGMASLTASQEETERLLSGTPIVIAGLNSSRHTVIAGEASALAIVVKRASEKGIRVANLPVGYAFHSPLVAPAVPALAKHLQSEKFLPMKHPVASTVTGERLDQNTDLQALLAQQITSPVRFLQAVNVALEQGVDLWIEAGPGQLMKGLLGDLCTTPAISVDAGGRSLRGLLEAAGAAFVCGTKVNHRALFAGRFVRPFDLDHRPTFFVNPCERAPLPDSKITTLNGHGIQPRGESEGSHSASATNQSAVQLVRALVAEFAELPLSSIADEHRMLSDLHLNSITVSQLVAKAARQLGFTPPPGPTQMADASVAQIARGLEELARHSTRAPQTGDFGLKGVDGWVRSFTIERVERPLRRRPAPDRSGTWRVIGRSDHPQLDSLKQVFSAPGTGNGVVVCLGEECDEQTIELLLDGARMLLSSREPGRLVIVQPEGPSVGAAFARSFYLENPESPVSVVSVPFGHAKASELVFQEAISNVSYSEACYAADGRRTEPVLRHLSLEKLPSCEWPVGSGDVLLVTGGGKGIAAECALTLAREKGTKVALVGRTDPSRDEKIRENLERFKAAGIHAEYFVADITDRSQVERALRDIESRLGKTTAVLHGAAVNVPGPIRSLDKAAFLNTLAPKVQGALNLLAALDEKCLRLFISFGSVIARTGMHGEAHYALANEWLTQLTEAWQKNHPHCRCLALEWSVWSGLGMGERLGRIEALQQEGVAPISPEEGTKLFSRVLSRHVPCVSLVATSRFGQSPTLKIEEPLLPLLRFLETPRLFFPGVELVADVQLSQGKDPYLDDHVLQGQRILPAVMSLEAMAQAAMALGQSAAQPTFENAQFLRPIIIPDHGSATIRLACLADESGRIEIVLRSDSTDYQVDHCRAVCHFASADGREASAAVTAERMAGNLEFSAQELYGGILFQSGRFQRLRKYRVLRATECVAEVAMQEPAGWFGDYVPQEMVLGDPGARDAIIHGIQACIPHAHLLPIGIDRLQFYSSDAASTCLMHAKERLREGNLFIYDIDVVKEDGGLLERWEGLRLQQVNELHTQKPWPEVLLGPYVERRLKELVPGSEVRVVVERNTGLRTALQSERMIQRALRQAAPVLRRPDGRPQAGDGYVSAAHTNGLTMVVTGPRRLGCDVERVVPRPAQVWDDLLGDDRAALASVIARENTEDKHAAATRVWAALECMKKAGLLLDAPLVLDGLDRKWVQLRSGAIVIATLVTATTGNQDALCLAVLVAAREESAALPAGRFGKAVQKERRRKFVEGTQRVPSA